MNKLTKADLANLSRWIDDTVKFDSYIQEVDDLLYGLGKEPSYHSLSSSLGSYLCVYVYLVASPTDLIPYIRRFRQYGFKREYTTKADGKLQIGYRTDDGRSLTFLAWFAENENNRCRTVKVGEAVQPVYQKLCGEELKAWEEENE